MSANWQSIFHKYLLKVENDTRTTLQMISEDMDGNGSTFNQELRNILFDLTNARISLAYKEFSLLSTNETTLNGTVTVHDDVDSGPKIMIGPGDNPKDSPKTHIWPAIASFQHDNPKPNTITTNAQPDSLAFVQTPQQQQKSTVSLFGHLSLEAPPITSLFDKTLTSKGFDVAKSAGIGFNTNQGSSSLTINGGFGTIGNAKISPFSWQLIANGTSIAKFQPLNDTDTLMKSGETRTVNTNCYCIAAMKEYEGKSLEELRLEDYFANRKNQCANGISDGGLFGTTHDDTIVRVPTP